MKRTSYPRFLARAAMTLLAVFCCLTGARAQNELTVYEGTATNNHVPAYVFYFDDFSRSQFVIPADDLSEMADGTISTIKFYTTSSNIPYTSLSTVNVYLMEVDFTTMTGLLPTTNIVYQGTLEFVSEGDGGSLTINLQNPYHYGGQNLLIGIDNTTDAGYKSINFYGTEVTGAAWAGSNSSSLDAVTGQVQNFIPKTTFEYTPGSGVIIEKPSTFEVSDVTAYGAKLTWSGGTGTYNLELKEADGEYEELADETTETSLVLDDLAPATAYSARIQSVDGEGNTSGWKTVSFVTREVCPDGKVCIGAGESTNIYLPTYSYYNYSLTQQIYTANEIGEEGFISSVDFFCTGAVTRNLDIYMVSTDKESFKNATDWVSVTADDLVFSGEVTFKANDWTTIDFENLFEYNGDSNVVLVVDDNTGSYVSAPNFYVFDATNQAIRVYSDGTDYDPSAPTSYSGTVMNVKNRVRLAVGEAPAVLKPTGLTVNYEGGQTAEVSWTQKDDAKEWVVAYKAADDATFTEATVTNTPQYTLSDLDLATTYEVKVCAKIDSDVSEWAGPVSFTTDKCLPEDMCSLTFEMADSYGDGWNGATIAIYDYTGEEVGDLLATVTLSNGAEDTQTLNFCNGQELAIIWYGGSYDDECSYTITDINGEIIAQDDFELAIPYTIDCTVTDCRRPTDFAASEIGPRSVVLSWTENGEATAWNIVYMSENDEDVTTITVESNPYTLEGLDPETLYAAQVTPVCEVEKPSEAIIFTTAIATPAPTDLAATNVTATSATLNWEGFGSEYNVRYRIASSGEVIAEQDFENGIGGWTTIDADGDGYDWVLGSASAGVYHNANVDLTDSGHNDSSDFIISGSYSNAVQIALTPDNYLVSPKVALGGKISFWAQAQDENYFAEHFGVAVSTTGNTDAADFTTIAQWTLNVDGTGAKAGSWGLFSVDLSDYDGQEGYVAIRHFNCSDQFLLNIDDIVIEGPSQDATEWITLENISGNSVDIEGLDPETEYTWQVQAIFEDEDNPSQWSTSTFTTGSFTDAPTDLEVTEFTSTTATLKWAGSQESYNVMYRSGLSDPTAPAIVILTAPDVWGDGTGYQMLLDADATAYGTIIPETGGLTTIGDASDEIYAEFEYKIPTNADGALTTSNVLIDNSIAIEIPAGTYDWCITNPTPNDRVWIASSNGPVPGRYDDFVFEPGVTYEFTLSVYGQNDGVDLTETRPMGDWITVENVTNPYELTGLTPDTYYEWQVQGILDEGTTDWVPGSSFTTLPLVDLANDGTANSGEISNYATKNVDVTLSGRTLFKDGKWNTICLPFDVTLEGSPLEGAIAKTLNSATMTDKHVSLTFGEAVTTLEAGVPYIIKWEDGEDIVNPTFTNVLVLDIPEDERIVSPIDEVKFIGYYDAFEITSADQNIYYMTANNTLKYTGVNRTLKACRAYFEFSESAARGFTLDFGDGEASGITSIDNEQLNNESGWYTVDGKKLEKQPTRKGVYINNGIKVVIK